jgi:PAS domain S-box-containing protein
MPDEVQVNSPQTDLQDRILELESENARLRSELEQRKYSDSQPRLRSALEHAAVAYAMTDADGRFVDANAAYCRLTGYSVEELQQLHLSDLIHPDDYEANMHLIRRQMAGETPPFQVENRYVRKDGQPVWVRKSVSWVLGPEGDPQGLVALVEDITQHRQMEQERRTSERIYRAIGEAIPYGIWICDPTGRNMYASQSYLDLVGMTQEQCSEFGWGDALHPDDAERTIAAWKECVRTEGTWDIEHRFRGTDGQYHPILARGIPVRNEEGEIICWAGINLDISRLKGAEEALRVSEERFQIAVKNSPMLVYTTDRQLRYTWVFNPVFGVTAAQVIGKTDEETLRPEDVAELVALKRSVLETGIGRRQEVQMPNDGVMYTFDLTVEPTRNESGSITGLTVAAVDITENKEREKKALQSQMRIELQRRLLEQREQERLTLARDLHDGPIQTLAAMTMDLEVTRAAFDDSTLQLELSRIDRHLREVSRELRDTVSDLRPSLLHTMGLSQAIRAYTKGFQRKHPELKLTLHMAADQGKLSKYIALSLFRIYQEALTNVVRHAGATRVSIHLEFTSDCCILEIRDNGKGMECLPDLLALTTEGHYGLAGMKERAEAVNGEFELRTVPGKGTTVVVSVPLNIVVKAAA